jgi:hypothetical protein
VPPVRFFLPFDLPLAFESAAGSVFDSYEKKKRMS